MADGDSGNLENGEAATYEISTANWCEVDRDGRGLVRRRVLEPRFVTTFSLPYDIQAGSEGDSSLTRTESAHAAIIDNTSFESPDYAVYIWS